MSLYDITPEQSLVTLPGVQSYARASDGLVVTPVIGKAGITEALMGSDGVTAAEFPSLAQPRGFRFGWGDRVTVPDCDALSFTTGAADLPFSLAAFSHPDVVTASGTFVAKSVGLNVGEYSFVFAGTPFYCVYLLVVDNDAVARIGRQTHSIFRTGIPAVWTGTYDGSGLTAGIKIYCNSERVDGADTVNGAFVRMRNTDINLSVGSMVGGGYGTIGVISTPMVFDFELTPAQVAALSHRMKYIYGITP